MPSNDDDRRDDDDDEDDGKKPERFWISGRSKRLILFEAPRRMKSNRIICYKTRSPGMHAVTELVPLKCQCVVRSLTLALRSFNVN